MCVFNTKAANTDRKKGRIGNLTIIAGDFITFFATTDRTGQKKNQKRQR